MARSASGDSRNTTISASGTSPSAVTIPLIDELGCVAGGASARTMRGMNTQSMSTAVAQIRLIGSMNTSLGNAMRPAKVAGRNRIASEGGRALQLWVFIRASGGAN